MSEPTVCAVMLTRDRPAMARRAVAAFRAQTYEKKRLLIVNSGSSPVLSEQENKVYGFAEPCFIGIDVLTIGELRNHACKYASAHYAESWTRPEIFVHLDDDDISHESRIAEQVALLQSSGADAVGYNEVLFWRTRVTNHVSDMSPEALESGAACEQTCEAWLYSVASAAYPIGSSLAYWRRTWERQPFADAPKNADGASEYADWKRRVKCHAVSAMADEPRMICSIHGGNTMNYQPEKYPSNWKRVPHWDAHCADVMSL